MFRKRDHFGKNRLLSAANDGIDIKSIASNRIKVESDAEFSL